MHNKNVLEVMADRLFARNNGKKLEDGYKLGLAVEGGGMRGIVSAGMMVALDDLDMLDIFDIYVGVSSGSFNLAYALSDQPTLGLSFYFDEMTSNKVIDLLRFRAKEHPIIDILKCTSPPKNIENLMLEN